MNIPQVQYGEGLPSILTRDCADDFLHVIAEIYQAEKAALQFFEILDDDRVVETSAQLSGAKQMLLRDEVKHMDDFVNLARMLDREALPEIPGADDDLWSVDRWIEDYHKPIPGISVAFTMMLVEGLGYAFLRNLTDAVVDADIRQALEDNIVDEQRHLNVSIRLMASELTADWHMAAELMVTLTQFLVASRDTASRQRVVLDRLGFDYFAVFSSSVRFVRDLFLQAAGDAKCELDPRFLSFVEHATEFYCSADYARLTYGFAKVPTPDWVMPGLYSFSSFIRQLR